MKNFTKKIHLHLLDFIFPRSCINCNKLIGKNYFGLNLCNDCYEHIKTISTPYCEICGEPFTLKAEYHRSCNECKGKKPYYNFLYGATVYNNEIIKNLVHALKYKHKYFLAFDMSFFMYKAIQQNCTHIDLNIIDFILPVPLYATKKRERGYNQSELLAKQFAKFANLKFNEKILYKTYDTTSQSKLNIRERERNLKKVFKVIDPKIIKNKNILLIDDVSTTGTTINECSKILSNAGCGSIYAFVFARTLKEK